ncbi:hypothetical protein CFIO01_04852 [Colletotrichum fioriniae PJ7]|uniref:Uncharacterized protein n=1 Tax=Colletotrichum fioriniae PJ7 TaxID=1445577 RepID=A0A010QUX9_9PEZI|nr:hypothetical protein CFIO01_04852 [Colletotrichum fioriniae PJ7]
MAYGLDNITRWRIPPSDLIWDIDANCKLFADFANTIIRKSSEYSMWDYCAIDPDALRAYVLSSLPPDLQAAATNATSSDITQWYMLGCDYAELQNGCESNADIAGIGVAISLCIEAFLVVAFFTSHMADFVRDHETSSSSPPSRVGNAFRAVLPAFYWSSVILNLGIVAASLRTAAAVSGDDQAEVLINWRNGGSLSPYDVQLAALVSLFSFQPTFMAGLMLAVSGERRRVTLNLAIVPVLGLLLVPLLYMTMTWISVFPRMVASLLTDEFDPSYVNLVAKNTVIVSDYITWATLVICGIKVTSSFANRLMSRRPRQEPRPLSSRIMIGVYLIQLISIMTMLISLYVFFWLRSITIGLGDGNDPQLDWGFGQILALTTWIPVIVDFIYTYIGKSMSFLTEGPHFKLTKIEL